jgi:transposase-like protein
MVARKHSLSVQTVYAWVRQSRDPSGADARSRVRELEKQLNSSRLENEILKELLKKTNLAWLGGSQLPESLSKAGGVK